ncbi:unnamed protein product [Oppiella nova]|uniref:Uncharacterized protein n=1 Tax=Oppiella nova TaxID=334625 RepID=A0A7R9QTC1_9ACAR|nr:unnamed protein product [Oppiella nova]CAG2173628.1 unnamed protein product [Oppiella nova]
MNTMAMRKAIQKHQMLKVSALMSSMAQRAMSAGSAHPNPNPHGWKSWRDIPDSMIPTTSKRDPNNPIYGTRKYVDYRKQQIWFQIPDGVPVFLKGGTTDKVLYYGLWVAVTTLVLVNAYHIGDMIFGKPTKKA